LLAWFATELHGEMLPDWVPLANDACRRKRLGKRSRIVNRHAD
jgi:hypothetical protein